jgi:DNA-binding SARP family transcriptional activator
LKSAEFRSTVWFGNGERGERIVGKGLLVAAAFPRQKRAPHLSASTGVRVKLSLLRTFELVGDGTAISLPMSVQRVVAFIALCRQPRHRAYVAGCLWLDTPEERAQANLRSALWRLRRGGYPLIRATASQLQLDPAVEVDLHEAEALAASALEDGAGPAADVDLAALDGDLLPDWYDEWVLLERERFRQLRLRALDSLCDRLARAGRHREALEVGHAAVAAEPLRESAHRALVRVHLAEGNAAEAIRQYRLFRKLVSEQLGIAPSARMEALIQGIDASVTAW